MIWAIKSLIKHYVFQFLEKKRYCSLCIEMGNSEPATDSAWRITMHTAPMFICDSCKVRFFRGDNSAEAFGFVVRDIATNITTDIRKDDRED